ncbi:MAG: RecQ family ATP-dependent DNA helicase [Spirochaetes bacterium]|nr:RecQ family ATP-dependent DNA helicase [Spirochaetota bacterium]
MDEPLPSLESEEDIVASLAKSKFGIPYLFPLQRMAMANVIDAADTEGPFRQLVLFPTGFGKSLCFQLPALLVPGISLVVYPLLALMNDQKRSLDEKEIPSSLIRGGMSKEAWDTEFASLENGRSRILITNPECLALPRLKDFLAKVGVFHIAVDEAHCVSEWGETFRPSYLDLGSCIQAIGPKVVSAFTATASPEVAEAVTKHIFGDAPYSLVTADMDKPNIRYSVLPTLAPLHSLAELVRSKPKPLIVFDQSRAGVRRLCEAIEERTGIKARFYHAGLSREEKKAIETWFMGSRDGVLAATCAYGLGVDKRDIRTVIHFSPPPSAEAYIQESGRGGRDGSLCEAILLFDTLREEGRVLARASSKDMDESRERRRLAFLAYASTLKCRRSKLHALMGVELDSPCSGCDVCDGSARLESEGLAELRSFIGANPGRFYEEDCLRLLGLGAFGTKIRQGRDEPPACAGEALLGDWERKDLRILLNAALVKGYIQRIEGGFREKRLRLA